MIQNSYLEQLVRNPTFIEGDFSPFYEPQAVLFLIDCLNREDKSILENAVWILFAVIDSDSASEAAITKLCTLLHDEKEYPRIIAAHALAKLHRTEALPVLLQGIESENIPTKFQALIGLHYFGSVAQFITAEKIEELLQVLIDTLINQADRLWSDTKIHAYNPSFLDMICMAFQTLLSFKDTIEALINLLHHHDKDVRRTAVRLLGIAENKLAVPVLIESLHTPGSFYYLRYDIVGALGKIGSPLALPALYGMIKNADYGMKRQIIRALTRIGKQYPEWLPEIEKAINEKFGQEYYENIELKNEN